MINANDGFVLKRYDLTSVTPDNIAWGAYMGTDYDCKYNNPMQSCYDYTVNFSSTNISCFGENAGIMSAAVQVGTPPYRYVWNGVTSGPNFSPTYAISIQNLPAGDYTLEMLDGVGCHASFSAMLTQPDEIIADMTVVPPTAGSANGSATVTATGGVGTYTYQWNTTPPQNGSTATNLSAGVYSVTITDITNCSVVQTVDVFITGIAPSTQSGNSLLVYPNPADKTLFIQFNSDLPDSGKTTIYLYNSIGQTIFKQVMSSLSPMQIDVSNYPPGIYRLEITGNNFSQQQQVLLYR